MIPMHEQRTPVEEEARSMRLAGILMRRHPEWRRFVDLNVASPSSAALREAQRRMREAEWRGCDEGLLPMIVHAERCEASQAAFEVDRAAGRVLETGLAIDIFGRALVTPWLQHSYMAYDANGNPCFYLHWAEGKGPWAEHGVEAYRALVSVAHQVENSEHAADMRGKAALVWEHLTPEQRAEATE